MQNIYTTKEVKQLCEYVVFLIRAFNNDGLGVLTSQSSGGYFVDGVYCDGGAGSRFKEEYDIKHDTFNIGADTFGVCCESLCNYIDQYIKDRGIKDHGLILRRYPAVLYQYPGYDPAYLPEEQKWCEGGYRGYARLSIFNKEGEQVHL